MNAIVAIVLSVIAITASAASAYYARSAGRSCRQLAELKIRQTSGNAELDQQFITWLTNNVRRQHGRRE